MCIRDRDEGALAGIVEEGVAGLQQVGGEQLHGALLGVTVQGDRHAEERAVELFAANLLEAGSIFLDNPGERPFIPSWNRVRSAIPDLLGRLHDAVEADNDPREEL